MAPAIPKDFDIPFVYGGRGTATVMLAHHSQSFLKNEPSGAPPWHLGQIRPIMSNWRVAIQHSQTPLSGEKSQDTIARHDWLYSFESVM